MDSKALVAYFSASGQTAKLAKTIAEVAGADLREIQPERPYTEADLNWHDRQSRSSLEMGDPTSRPELADDAMDLSGYGVIYLGFPIWWYTAPHIVLTFLEDHDLTGKTVVPFCTSGSSGFGDTLSALQASAAPGTLWKAGTRLTPNESPEKVRSWLAGLGL